MNSTLHHVDAQALKVEAFAEAVTLYRGPGVAKPIPASLLSREAILAAAEGDVLFSCVDTLKARQLCDLLSSAFLLPLFDVGVVTGALIGAVLCDPNFEDAEIIRSFWLFLQHLGFATSMLRPSGTSQTKKGDK